ncbi:MAG: methyltransferase domain-containing protein [Pseudomonadota bacterium]
MTKDPSQYVNSANLARRGDLHAAYSGVSWFAWVADRLELSAGADVLDVGSGPAWFWRKSRWAGQGLKLTVLDSSPGMVAEAEKGLSEAGFAEVTGIVAHAGALPLSDNAFDAVTLMHVLYHLPEPEAAFTEALRVLRPGGQLHVTLNAHDDLQAITDVIIDVFGREPFDFAASRTFLDRGEALMSSHFTDVTRHDLVETYNCDDHDILQAFTLSMPPANRADDAGRQNLLEALARAMEDGDGVLSAERHSGLITGTKPLAQNNGAP